MCYPVREFTGLPRRLTPHEIPQEMLTCEACKTAPATHVVVYDWQGRPLRRIKVFLCRLCADDTPALPGGRWIFRLADATYEGGGCGRSLPDPGHRVAFMDRHRCDLAGVHARRRPVPARACDHSGEWAV